MIATALSTILRIWTIHLVLITISSSTSNTIETVRNDLFQVTIDVHRDEFGGLIDERHRHHDALIIGCDGLLAVKALLPFWCIYMVLVLADGGSPTFAEPAHIS
jgi:hypothetical protein